MAVTLAEAAVTAQDPRLPGVVGVLNTSQIMNRIAVREHRRAARSATTTRRPFRPPRSVP